MSISLNLPSYNIHDHFSICVLSYLAFLLPHPPHVAAAMHFPAKVVDLCSLVFVSVTLLSLICHFVYV